MIFEYNVDSKLSGIYEIRNRLSGKSYIGSANRIKDRWKSHASSLRCKQHQNKHLQYSFSKAMESMSHDDFIEFHVVEIMQCSSKEERLERETYWIKLAIEIYGRENIYNMRLDPMQETKEWSKDPEKTKEKMSAAHRSKKLSEDTKRRISVSKKGVPNTTASGVPRSEATKQRISEANTGKRRSDEAKKRMREASSGHAAWNKGLTGEANPIHGHEVSEETRRKISIANKGRVMHEDIRKKMSECHRGIPCSDAAKEKLRKAFTGRLVSEETRARLKEAWKRRKSLKLQDSTEVICIFTEEQK
jgi:group I intron endonuclease